MQKVLVISYFFPPCNLTASQRVNSWGEYLHKSGYHPIIITRKWEKQVKSFKDCHYSTSTDVLIEKNENYEVHFCPYKANLRDHLHTQNKMSYLKKTLSFFEIIFQNIWVKLCPFNNLLFEAEKIIEKEKNINSIIISGNPFIQFKFGYKLNKKYKIPWIADYRDAWTTSTINNIQKNKFLNLINKYHRFFEKKWIKTASFITASSEPIGKSISEITNVPSAPIYNGFEPDDFLEYELVKKNSAIFQIVYVGTLYNGQDISIFLNAYKKLIDQKNAKTKLLFPGLDLDKIQKNRIEKIMTGYEEYYQTSSRIPKSEILKLEKSSHLLLHVAWKGHDGIIASKIYEYIGSGSKTIIVPGDKGSIDEIVKQSNSGVVFHDFHTTFDFLCKEYDSFVCGNASMQQKNNESIQFTRENQTMKLAELINKIAK
jgi:glycosyltransferase involved in cell wall biosynthesis